LVAGTTLSSLDFDLVKSAPSQHWLVSLLALLDSEWALRSRYGFNIEVLLNIFHSLLEAREVVAQERTLTNCLIIKR
jgi:hypothetical protein